MTVLWQTYDAQDISTIEWGVSESCDRGKIAVAEKNSEGDIHRSIYTITGLPPSTVIYYKVTAGEVTYPGTFLTAPASSKVPLTFYALGDSRSNPAVLDKVLGQLLAGLNETDACRTFCLHSGDYVTRGAYSGDWDEEYFNRYYKNTTRFLSTVPVMGCAGNHEGNGELFRKYFPYPFEDKDYSYYSFDYGPVHVAVLDQYATDYDKQSSQYSWLENDLTNTTKPWKLVLLHDPLWCATPPRSSDEDILVYRRDLQPLFEKNGVSAVIQGHRHYYSRCRVNGIEYITVGGGGAELYDPSGDVPYLEAMNKSHHFARFDVSEGGIYVRIIGENGALLDSFEIRKL